jgi:hypothetical protein
MEKLLSYQLTDGLAVHNSLFYEAPAKKVRCVCSVALWVFNLEL